MERDTWREKFISTYELAFYKKACLLSSGKDDSTKMTATLLQILFLIRNSEIKLPQQSSNHPINSFTDSSAAEF